MSYYSLADNYDDLGIIFRLLKYSCQETFASKLRLKNTGQVIQKFGFPLYVQDVCKKDR